MKKINNLVDDSFFENTSNEDFIGEDGITYCSKCKEPLEIIIKHPISGENRKVSKVCSCTKEIWRREQELIDLKVKQQRLRELQKSSLLGEKYKNVSFEKTETNHNEKYTIIFNRCKKYCDVANKVLEQGIGIYLFGTKGTGKSHLTACMANELMNNNYTVLYTNFFEISQRIRNTYSSNKESEYDFLDKLSKIQFLFIDDFGTELVTKNGQDAWLQEKVFEIINKRYNNNKPIIFTSNYSLRQLMEERGIAEKTIDRINEMCEVMKLEGVSYRQTIKAKREKFF